MSIQRTNKWLKKPNLGELYTVESLSKDEPIKATHQIAINI